MKDRPGACLKTDSEWVRKRKRKLEQMRKSKQVPVYDTIPLLFSAILCADKSRKEPEDPEPVAVSSVYERRVWLHRKRCTDGQDSWLEDYRYKDPHLTLDWDSLDTSSIEDDACNLTCESTLLHGEYHVKQKDGG